MPTVCLGSLIMMVAYYPEIFLEGHNCIVLERVLEVAVDHALQRNSITEIMTHLVDSIDGHVNTDIGILEAGDSLLVPFFLGVKV